MATCKRSLILLPVTHANLVGCLTPNEAKAKKKKTTKAKKYSNPFIK